MEEETEGRDIYTHTPHALHIRRKKKHRLRIATLGEVAALIEQMARCPTECVNSTHRFSTSGRLVISNIQIFVAQPLSSPVTIPYNFLLFSFFTLQVAAWRQQQTVTKMYVAYIFFPLYLHLSPTPALPILDDPIRHDMTCLLVFLERPLPHLRILPPQMSGLSRRILIYIAEIECLPPPLYPL